MDDLLGQASFYQETILKDMDELRKYADEAEAVIPDEYLSYPTYGQMLFSLR
jgi:glutamine synthetase